MRTRNKDNFCVILAGGKGRRLWPCSREDMPKQFVDFFSTGRTLLQQTFDRMSKLIPVENIYVNTNNVYAHFVEEQLPEIPIGNILSEPIFRNTAPSTAWATYRIYHKNSTARIVVTPSDMAVFNEEAFLDNIERGLNLVSERDALPGNGCQTNTSGTRLWIYTVWRKWRNRFCFQSEVVHGEAGTQFRGNVHEERRVSLE